MRITIKNVSAGYDKSNMVLKDISTVFDGGGVWGILGPNGSGKTTFLRMLSGTLDYSGSVVYSEEELRDIPRKKLATYLALTPQFSSIYFSYSIYDTVMMGRYSHSSGGLGDILGKGSKQDREIVDEILEKTELKDISDRQLSELSGGQLQRVYLARTLAQKTPVILLDEPTNHLDIRYNNEMMSYLKKWSKETTEVEGVSHRNMVISVFHDIGLASVICDNVLLMKEGSIIKEGPVRDALKRNLLEDLYGIDVYSYYKNIMDSFEDIT